MNKEHGITWVKLFDVVAEHKAKGKKHSNKVSDENENVESALEEGGFEIEGDCMVVQQWWVL